MLNTLDIIPDEIFFWNLEQPNNPEECYKQFDRIMQWIKRNKDFVNKYINKDEIGEWLDNILEYLEVIDNDSKRFYLQNMYFSQLSKGYITLTDLLLIYCECFNINTNEEKDMKEKENMLIQYIQTNEKYKHRLYKNYHNNYIYRLD